MILAHRHFHHSSNHDMKFVAQKGHDVNIVEAYDSHICAFMACFSIELVGWLATQGLLLVKLVLGGFLG